MLAPLSYLAASAGFAAGLMAGGVAGAAGVYALRYRQHAKNAEDG